MIAIRLTYNGNVVPRRGNTTVTSCLQNPHRPSITVSGLRNLDYMISRSPARSKPAGVGRGCHLTLLETWPWAKTPRPTAAARVAVHLLLDLPPVPRTPGVWGHPAGEVPSW